MFQDNYTHDSCRRYHTYFAALFSSVYIDRELSDGSIAARFKVPLHFAKIEHALERVQEDPDITRPEAIALPAMSFDMIDAKYSPERHQATRNRLAGQIQGDPNRFDVMHVPVPYDFHFRLSILIKNIDDGLKIIEQILPYFAPDYTANLEMIPEMGIFQDVPVVLESTSMDFDVPNDYKTRVTYIWVLDFNLQGYLYGPIKKWPVIKFANVSFGVAGSNSIFLTVTSQPGHGAGRGRAPRRIVARRGPGDPLRLRHLALHADEPAADDRPDPDGRLPDHQRVRRLGLRRPSNADRNEEHNVIEFFVGVAATLGAEFLLAQLYLWRASKGSTVSVVKAAVGNSAVFGAVSTVIQHVEAEIPAELTRVEDFFENLFRKGAAANTTANTPVTTVLLSGNVQVSNTNSVASSNATPANT